MRARARKRKGFIETGKLVETIKRVDDSYKLKHGYNSYRLSEKGVAFLLQLDNDIDAQKVFQKYGYEVFSETLRAWQKKFGKSFVRQVQKIAGVSLLATGKEVKPEDFHDYLATASILTINQMPPEERQRTVKVIRSDRKLNRDLHRVMRHLKKMK